MTELCMSGKVSRNDQGLLQITLWMWSLDASTNSRYDHARYNETLLAATGIHYIKLENHKSVGPSF